MSEEYPSISVVEIPENSKRCTKCGEVKLLEFFDLQSKSKDGRRQPCRECRKKYREEHSEELSKKQMAYYAEHLEEYVEWRREYRARNIETLRVEESLRYKKHPESFIYQLERRRRLLNELPNNFTEKNMQFARLYWHNQCAVCGCGDENICKLLFDHWIPIGNSNCPGTVPDNMVLLCNTKKGTPLYVAGCNQSKGAKLPSIWLRQRFGESFSVSKMAEIQRFFEEAVLFSTQEGS